MPDDIAPDTSRAQEQNPEFWKDYAMAALEKWRETERSVTHTAALMLLLAALFELIKRRNVAELSLPLVKLGNPDLVLIFLPVVLAYLFLTWSELTAEVDWCGRAYDYSLMRVLPDDPHGWYRGALTPGASVITIISRLDFIRKRPSEKLTSVSGYAKLVIFLVWPVVFEIYAYVTVFGQRGVSTVLVAISAFVTFLLLGS